MHRECAHIRKDQRQTPLAVDTRNSYLCTFIKRYDVLQPRDRTESHLKCRPSQILIGAEALQSREQNSVSTEVSANELHFVSGWSQADWNYTAVSDQTTSSPSLRNTCSIRVFSSVRVHVWEVEIVTLCFSKPCIKKYLKWAPKGQILWESL